MSLRQNCERGKVLRLFRVTRRACKKHKCSIDKRKMDTRCGWGCSAGQSRRALTFYCPIMPRNCSVRNWFERSYLHSASSFAKKVYNSVIEWDMLCVFCFRISLYIFCVFEIDTLSSLSLSLMFLHKIHKVRNI